MNHPLPQIPKNIREDFPGGPVVKKLPFNAGDMGLISGRGTKVPHAAEQLSLHKATTELPYSGACLPQLESLHTATKIPRATAETQGSQINFFFKMPI